MNAPQISVVMATKNPAEELYPCIDSVSGLVSISYYLTTLSWIVYLLCVGAGFAFGESVALRPGN